MVKRLSSSARPESRAHERGQIIIVAGLLLAVTFVGLALVANTAIFAENIASRDTGNENGEPLRNHAWVNESISRTMDRLNANHSTNSFSTINDSLQKAVNNQSDGIRTDGAERGVVLDLERGDPQRGVRLRQTNESRNFSDMNGNANWNLTDVVSESGQFTMQLQRGDIFTAGFDTTMAALADSAFGIEIYDEDYAGSGDGVWRIYFFQGAGTNNIYAAVEHRDQNFTDLTDGTLTDHVVDGWLNQSCSTVGTTVVVKIEKGTMGGSPCEHFSFYESAGTHTIGFTNAYTEDAFGNHQERGVGTYDILVKGNNFNSGVFHQAGNGQPFQQSAIYNQNVTVTYRNDGTTYTVTNHTVVPKNLRNGGVLWAFPRIEQFDVTQTDNDPPTFDIDWHVSHPQGELDNVELLLIDKSGTASICVLLCGTLDAVTETLNTNKTVDSTNVSVSGPTATGSHQLLHQSGFDSINQYTVRIIVEDRQGRARVASEDFEVNT